jgi:hypothetical protein
VSSTSGPSTGAWDDLRTRGEFVAPLTIRRRRDEDVIDLPRHFERAPLHTSVKLAAWPCSVVAAVVGVWWMVTRDGSPLEVVGAVLAGAAAVVVLGLVRWRAFETTVGGRWVEIRSGPIRHRIPLEFVDVVAVRSARGWRRLYAPTEVVLRLGSGAREVALASRESGELVSAIEDARRGGASRAAAKVAPGPVAKGDGQA